MRSQAAPQPAVVAIKATDVRTPAVRHAIAGLKREALASGRDARPDRGRRGTPTHTVARVTIPLDGNGTDDDVERSAREPARPDRCRPPSARSTARSTQSRASRRPRHDSNAMMKALGCRSCSASCSLFAFLLLLVSFRSIVIAVKAIVLNLLSVGAAYGVLVVVFQ